MTWSKEDGKQDDRCDRQHHYRPGGDSLALMPENGADEPRTPAKHPGEATEWAKTIDPLPGSHDGRHEQGAHQHDTDAAEAEDDGRDD